MCIRDRRTDETHRLNVPQLVQLLENQGILAERKSIYSDIDTLRSLGYEMCIRDRKKRAQRGWQTAASGSSGL